MGVLPNARHERFCQEVAKGRTQEAAYIEAGYATNGARAHAARLAANGNIIARIAELQERGAIRAEITIADLVAELEQARGIALKADIPQSSAAVSATMGKAKLLGLLVDKAEVTGKDGEPLGITYVTPPPVPIPQDGYDTGAP